MAGKSPLKLFLAVRTCGQLGCYPFIIGKIYEPFRKYVKGRRHQCFSPAEIGLPYPENRNYFYVCKEGIMDTEKKRNTALPG